MQVSHNCETESIQMVDHKCDIHMHVCDTHASAVMHTCANIIKQAKYTGTHLARIHMCNVQTELQSTVHRAFVTLTGCG